MTRVKFVCNYNSDLSICRFVDDIWGNQKDIQLTYQNDYDVLVIFNKYYPQMIKPNSKVFGFIQEPSWSGFYDKNLPNYCDKVFYHKPEIFNKNNVIFNPSVMLHHLWDKPQRGEIQWSDNNTKSIVESKFDKIKKLSIIISNRENEIQYQIRQNLVKKLLDSDIDFDMYGLGWNLNDSRYKGFLSNKLDGLRDYKYSICIENTRENGYITEKFNDAILCGTVPLYYGAPDVDKHYPNSSEFLDISSENVIEDIENIINTNKYYDIDGAKKKYLIDYNPLTIIKINMGI